MRIKEVENFIMHHFGFYAYGGFYNNRKNIDKWTNSKDFEHFKREKWTETSSTAENIDVQRW